MNRTAAETAAREFGLHSLGSLQEKAFPYKTVEGKTIMAVDINDAKDFAYEQMADIIERAHPQNVNIEKATGEILPIPERSHGEGRSG